MRKPWAKQLVLAVLIIVFSLSAWDFFRHIFLYGDQSLQMDFAGSYTAGESLNHGLSPYTNNLLNRPPIWDGVSIYKHSSFIYTPFAALFFRLIALAPYAAAKYLWMVGILACIWLVFVVVARYLSVKATPEMILGLGIFAFLFIPLRLELERGQIDALTLLLMWLAVGWMISGGKRRVYAGIAFAAASFFKLYCVFVIPFLILRRRWDVLKGYAAGVLLITCISLIFTGRITFSFWNKELPRISRFLTQGSAEMLLPEGVVRGYLESSGTSSPWTVKSGVRYQSSVDDGGYFVTLVQPLNDTRAGKSFFELLKKVRLEVYDETILGLIILAGLILLVIFLRLGSCRAGRSGTPLQEVLYWQTVFILILLSGTKTWMMNAVWLLPTGILIIVLLREAPGKSVIFWALVGILGLAWLMIPYSWLFKQDPHSVPVLCYRYAFSAGLVAVSLLAVLKNIDRPDERIRSLS